MSLYYMFLGLVLPSNKNIIIKLIKKKSEGRGGGFQLSKILNSCP